MDRFGNAITNITQSFMEAVCIVRKNGPCKVIFRGKEVPLKSFYAEGEKGILCSVLNSSGLLEFFISGGNAEEQNGITIGERVMLQ